VCESLKSFNEQKEKTTIRLIMKHLRNKGYHEAFKALSKETNIELEDEAVTDLFHQLVDKGDFEKSEQILSKFIEAGEVEEYIQRQKYKAKFAPIELKKDNITPKTRFHSSFAFVAKEQSFYMFGGCDDNGQEYDDMWAFRIAENRWELVQEHAELVNGAFPRSGQKMVYDSLNQSLFLLGRRSSKADDHCKVSESHQTASLANLFHVSPFFAFLPPFPQSDFYLFDVVNKSWFLICEDTSAENGPKLISEHQMALNTKMRLIYVFGGKVINKNAEENTQFSGLYTYHINTSTWNLIYLDLSADPDVRCLKSRSCHSMLHDSVRV